MNWEWTDVLWHVLAYPIYQVLGTLRHELCHAIVARSFGAQIIEFRILPHRRDGRWFWGYVSYSATNEIVGAERWLFMMSPYIVDALLVAAWFVVRHLHEFRSFHWFAFATVMLLVSPVVDTGYNFLKYLLFGTGDFARASEGA